MLSKFGVYIREKIAQSAAWDNSSAAHIWPLIMEVYLQRIDRSIVLFKIYITFYKIFILNLYNLL